MSFSPIPSDLASHAPLDRVAIAALISEAISSRPAGPLPSQETLATTTSSLASSLSTLGLGQDETLQHLLSLPASFSSAHLNPHYYAFVSGASLPIAEAADMLVSSMDLNVMVHDPAASLATVIEAKALSMLCELLHLDPEEWQGRTLTSGATGSNILGLAAARDELVRRRLEAKGSRSMVGELGLMKACKLGDVEGVQIIAAAPHSSVYKAAGVLGLGRGEVLDVGRADAPWRFDWEKVEEAASKENTLTIAVVGAGEVNTGGFGGGELEMARLRQILDRYNPEGAWIHVDGAFGIFARALPQTAEFEQLRQRCEGLQYADSIGADAHKCLNVPYDSAFLLTRSPSPLNAVCSNGSAAYLATHSADSIPSPLNISLENSRRFRALPLYAVLLAHGRQGLGALFASQVRLARALARVVEDLDGFELLPEGEREADRGVIVLFRAREERLNGELVERINGQNRIYVSGTVWEGRKAVRIAVAGWKIDAEADARVVREVLVKALL